MERILKKTTASYPVVGAIGKQSSYVNNNSIVTETWLRFNHFISAFFVCSWLYSCWSTRLRILWIQLLCRKEAVSESGNL